MRGTRCGSVVARTNRVRAGGFLQRLEQGVLRRCGKLVNLVDDVDLVAPAGTARIGFAHAAAARHPRCCARGRVHLHQVDEDAGGDRAAVVAGGAGFGLDAFTTVDSLSPASARPWSCRCRVRPRTGRRGSAGCARGRSVKRAPRAAGPRARQTAAADSGCRALGRRAAVRRS